jgi:hypothetical protein
LAKRTPSAESVHRKIDWAEDLLLGDFKVGIYIYENRWGNEVSCGVVAGEALSARNEPAVLACSLDHGDDAVGRCLADHWSHHRGLL